MHLWHIPPRSPDLNPAERMWAWARRKLRDLDLADFKDGRKAVKKSGLKARIRALFRTQEAKVAAGNYVRGLRQVCREVIRRRGAATSK